MMVGLLVFTTGFFCGVTLTLYQIIEYNKNNLKLPGIEPSRPEGTV
jgi:hypothetical protein